MESQTRDCGEGREGMGGLGAGLSWSITKWKGAWLCVTQFELPSTSQTQYATYVTHKGDIVTRNVSKLYFGLKCYLVLMLCYENENVLQRKNKKDLVEDFKI